MNYLYSALLVTSSNYPAMGRSAGSDSFLLSAERYYFHFKGTVRRNLRWVQSNINRFVSLLARFASLLFCRIINLHLLINIILFLLLY